MKRWKTLPDYARLPLISVLVINFLAYFVSRLITSELHHFDLSLPLDRAIPLVPVFSVIYVLAYVQWVIGYIVIARVDADHCRRVLSGEIISKLICLAVFILLPTTLTRPEITGSGVFNCVIDIIYRADPPDNLLPSIHCLASWLCFRGVLGVKSVGRGYKVFSLVFTLLVCASTVLVKQHVVIDIFAGVLVCELGQLIARTWDTGRVFEIFENKKQSEKTDEKHR